MNETTSSAGDTPPVLPMYLDNCVTDHPGCSAGRERGHQCHNGPRKATTPTVPSQHLWARAGARSTITPSRRATASNDCLYRLTAAAPSSVASRTRSIVQRSHRGSATAFRRRAHTAPSRRGGCALVKRRWSPVCSTWCSLPEPRARGQSRAIHLPVSRLRRAHTHPSDKRALSLLCKWRCPSASNRPAVLSQLNPGDPGSGQTRQ